MKGRPQKSAWQGWGLEEASLTNLLRVWLHRFQGIEVSRSWGAFNPVRLSAGLMKPLRGSTLAEDK